MKRRHAEPPPCDGCSRDCGEYCVRDDARPEPPKPVEPPKPSEAWPPLWAGVALLCCVLTGGCSQFVLYQHNDHRTPAGERSSPKQGTLSSPQPSDPDPADGAQSTPDYSNSHSGDARLRGARPLSPPGRLHPSRSPLDPSRALGDRRRGRPARWFAGALAISPGLRHLAELAGDDCWVAHSAGAARAIRELLNGADPPRVLILIDPWPLQLEVPDGPELVIVVCGRPSVVTVGPGTRAVSKLRAAGSCPWAWTIGHLYACRWPESVEAAREAAQWRK